MKDELCFVQFLHPGKEPKPDKDIKWNTEAKHKRKFIKQKGMYLNGKNEKFDNIVFWGEWEPQSYGEEISNPIPDGPQCIFKPFYTLVDNKLTKEKSLNSDSCGSCQKGGVFQNTDPFVFGE